MEKRYRDMEMWRKMELPPPTGMHATPSGAKLNPRPLQAGHDADVVLQDPEDDQEAEAVERP